MCRKPEHRQYDHGQHPAQTGTEKIPHEDGQSNDGGASNGQWEVGPMLKKKLETLDGLELPGATPDRTT